jgi:prepilin-type N-terminal cleavage/methylation domain-containing protein
MVTRRRGAQRGFTLIELLVSMALSTIGLLGLMALQMIAVRGNMMSRNFGDAIGIAQQRLEQAAHTPYASLSTLAETNTTAYPTADTSVTAPNSYTRTTTVSVDAKLANTTTVTVKVDWNDTQQQPVAHHVTLVTVRSP